MEHSGLVANQDVESHNRGEAVVHSSRFPVEEPSKLRDGLANSDFEP